MPSMLGMLQNAQDQAASPPASPRNSLCPGGAAAISGGGAAAGNDLAGHKRTSRRMGLVGFGGGRDASRRNPTPVSTAAVVNKGKERPPLTSLPINQTATTVDHEEAPRLVGTIRRLRQNSVRIIQRLPGPKLLMQVLEEEIDPKNVRLTTQSEPVILMEVMPAALVVSLLVLTYLVFASGVLLIVWFHFRGTSTLAMGPGSGDGARELCTRGSSFTATVSTSGGEGDVFIIGADGPDLHSPSAAGCTVFSPGLSELSLDLPLLSSSTSTSSSLTDADAERYGAVFLGQFSGMTDLSGIVSLRVSFADTEVQESLPDPAAVDIALEACVVGVTAAVGESSSQADLEWGTCQEGWQPVLFQENISARVRSLPEDRGYTLFNFYQNQDTIRGQALVRQYRVQVGFVSTTASSSSSGGNDGSSEESFSWVSEAKWSLEYETGATTEWAKIVLAVVLMCWVPVWLAWCWTVFYKTAERGFENALHERKWLALIGLSVVFYINPIKVVGNFVAPKSASWGLASEMCLSVSVVLFLVVALCIAGGVSRDRVGGGPLGFYVPKAASVRIFMVRMWAVWMLFRMYTSGRLLRKLPYVPNRFRHLSYRFFCLQAILLSIVYMVFALWRLIDILSDDVGGKTVAAQLMLTVKTRQDHLGTVSSLCAYTLQLFLLFLPSSFKESKLFRDIAVRFVYFEEQLPIAMRKSRERGVDDSARGGQARDEGSIVQGAALNHGQHLKTSPGDVEKEDEEEKPIFCVETAAWFLQSEFNLDRMMPTGREHEVTKVLEEDIDIQAAESLHGVVAHMVSARKEEEEGYGDAFEEHKEPAGGAQVAPSHAVVACTPGTPPLPPSSDVAEYPPTAVGAADAAEGRGLVHIGPSGDDGGAGGERDVANASRPSPFPSPSAPFPRGSPCSGLVSSVGNLTAPRLCSKSMSLVSDIEEGEGKWLRRVSAAGTAAADGGGSSISGGGTRSMSTESPEGRGELLGGVGGRGEAQGDRGSSSRSHRGQSASFDHAAIVETGDGQETARPRDGEGRGAGGATWQMGGGGSPGAMEGLGQEFVGRKEDLVGGERTVCNMVREAATRGVEAVDKATHAMGINRIPFLKQCLWGQVHTGFWNAYECVRGDLHACVRETVIDWILSEDNPPDIKIYVTGHSMGGALATHCAMDLKLFTVDKIQARLGSFMRMRQTLMKVAGLPPRRNRQHPRDGSNAEDTARGNGSGGGSRGGRMDKTPPPKDGSRAPPRPPPSSASPTLPGNGDPKAVAAGGAAGMGGVAEGRNSLRGLARTLSRRFQTMGGNRVLRETGAAPHRDSDESRSDGRRSDGRCSDGRRSDGRRGDGRHSACSVPSGNGNDGEPRGGMDVLNRMASRLTTVASAFDPWSLVLSPTLRRPSWGSEVSGDGREKAQEPPPNPKIEVSMYSFGAPRAGNSIYAARFNDVVPDSFRVVVDGDPVPGVPSWWYTHVGTKVLIDGNGRGSLIIDPSFVEKRFFTRSKRYVLAHRIHNYQAGLRGNLLQAVPPELQGSVPGHWPYGIQDDSSTDSSSDDDDDTGTNERKEGVEGVGEEADTDANSEGDGVRPSSPISASLDIMAQQAVNALKRADKLNRGQSFRLTTRSVSGLSLRPAAPTPVVGASAGGGNGGTDGDGGRHVTMMTPRPGGGGGHGGRAEGRKRMLRLGGSRELATMEEGSD
ncbi:unnamed protein product [Ectocarpus fasciculatus]